MSDSAKGPLAGYLFQFEKALLVISMLENTTDFISIEEVDDVAVHNEDSTVLLSYQAKNSISASGSTFENTSRALWRTLEIWINKLSLNIFNDETKFICSTNKNIKAESLLLKIRDLKFEDTVELIGKLLTEQELKLEETQKKDLSKGASIKKTIKSIKYVLANQNHLEVIAKNLIIDDNESIRGKFFNQLHLSDNYSDDIKNSIFEEFYGWITLGSKAKWMNGIEANFTKKQFNDKLFLINSTSSIVNAIFRTKEVLGTINKDDIQKKQTELFVRQIEDIERNREAKERIIEEAILDFLYCDIETRYVIKEGNYTQKDFEKFRESCKDAWQKCFDENVIDEIESYDKKQKNTLAINIFTSVMNKIEIKFKNEFEFNPDNRYIRNGSFLKLSNIPEIGWHPEWHIKYIKDEK